MHAPILNFVRVEKRNCLFNPRSIKLQKYISEYNSYAMPCSKDNF